MISNLLPILIAILPIIFLLAITDLWKCSSAARLLRVGLANLKNGTSPEQSFPGNTILLRRAAAVARKAQQPGLVSQFRPERDLTVIADELSSRLGRTRALSGLLIILGLLITLTNLKSAVDEMKNALALPEIHASANLPKRSSPATNGSAPETQVRKGIGGIATAAGTAFGYSTFAIGLAALVLLLSVFTQRGATSAVAALAEWIAEKHDELLLKQAELPQDTAAQLAFAAEALARVAATFEETNAALSELKTLGGKFDSAANEISGAVAALPAHIDNSMTKISGDVAMGIKTGLEHQVEYLKSLVAIYSDHASVVQKTIEYISRITDANKLASDALVHLRSLPENIQAVADSTAQARTAIQELQTSVRTLNRKVDAIPADALSTAASHLTDAAARLIKIETDFATIQETTKALLKTTVDDHVRSIGEVITPQLDSISAIIHTIKTDVSSDAAKHTADLQQKLAQLQAAMDMLQSSAHRGSSSSADIRSLGEKLQQLTNSVGSLPSLQIMRFLSGGKIARS